LITDFFISVFVIYTN